MTDYQAELSRVALSRGKAEHLAFLALWPTLADFAWAWLADRYTATLIRRRLLGLVVLTVKGRDLVPLWALIWGTPPAWFNGRDHD